MNDLAKNLLLWVVILVVLMSVFQSFSSRSRGQPELAYSDFISQVEQGNVGVVGFGLSDRAVGIVGHSNDPVARVVLNQIFQRRRELRIILDNQDPKHREPPQPSEKSVDSSVARKLPYANPAWRG